MALVMVLLIALPMAAGAMTIVAPMQTAAGLPPAADPPAATDWCATMSRPPQEITLELLAEAIDGPISEEELRACAQGMEDDLAGLAYRSSELLGQALEQVFGAAPTLGPVDTPAMDAPPLHEYVREKMAWAQGAIPDGPPSGIPTADSINELVQSLVEPDGIPPYDPPPIGRVENCIRTVYQIAVGCPEGTVVEPCYLAGGASAYVPACGGAVPPVDPCSLPTAGLVGDCGGGNPPPGPCGLLSHAITQYLTECGGSPPGGCALGRIPGVCGDGGGDPSEDPLKGILCEGALSDIVYYEECGPRPDPEPCQQNCGGPCDPECPYARQVSELLASTLPVLAQAGALVLDVADQRHTYKQDAYDTSKPSDLPSEHYNILGSQEGQGKWQLTYAPADGLDELSPDVALGSCEVCSYAVVTVEFADEGWLEQTASYVGSNPVPVSQGEADIYEPQTDRQVQKVNEALCFAAALTVAAMIAGAPATASNPSTVAIFVASTITMVVTCREVVTAEASVGRWSATGDYTACWGCEDTTKWTGHLYGLNQQILEVSTEIRIDGEEKVTWDTSTPEPTGFEDKWRLYNITDNKTRHHAWDAHTVWGDQADDKAYAEIALKVPFLSANMDAVNGLVAQQIAEVQESVVYWSDGLLVLECWSTCGDSAILRISSPGHASVAGENNAAHVNFDGAANGATVSLLGLGLGGFTLNAQADAQIAGAR